MGQRHRSVEGLGLMDRGFWVGKRVFLTGHTGFKGGWLSLWLQELGAEVHGYALKAPTEPNLFTIADVAEGMASSVIADIRDLDSLLAAMRSAQPEIVFHLAAQPLVRYSFEAPVETYAVNVMGSVHLLEAVRSTPTVRAVVNVTTDKCYENKEWVWAYRENEPMGGYDPYSSSKGCAELVTAAYRNSFLRQSGVALASARAGNVIGGGDFALDRLLPDILRAVDAGQPVSIRYPQSVRPWQHVLEPLSGYLRLAQALCVSGQEFASAWNFGPAEEDARPVQWILETLARIEPGVAWKSEPSPLHEARSLKLDSSKAKALLGWRPRWNLQTALERTWEWHSGWHSGKAMKAVTLAQIHDYERDQGAGI